MSALCEAGARDKPHEISSSAPGERLRRRRRPTPSPLSDPPPAATEAPGVAPRLASTGRAVDHPGRLFDNVRA